MTMSGRLMLSLSALLASVLVLVACATSPTGRNQILLFDNAQMANMGDQAFAEYKRTKPIERARGTNSYVDCVANSIVSVLPPEARNDWDVAVFEDDSPNAFALPGGNIGVHTGLLDVAVNQDQLAAVIGHEIGHVLANHANARASTQALTETGLGLAGSLAGEPTTQQRAMLGALGLGAQVGVLLPFSRGQESEADQIGLELMAQAGFDPRQSVDLWQNMKRAGGGSPPEFLSTHPNPDNRIENLQSMMPDALAVAERSGRSPSCR